VSATLEVIGAGFGRTGTLSLKLALERLGFAPCYHMAEVLNDPRRAEAWIAAADGATGGLREALRGYRATVDWPACAFWRELTGLFPEARVLLSVRPPERWYASFRETIYEALTRVLSDPAPAPEMLPFRRLGQRVVVDRSFGGRLGSREEIVAAYERHNAEVRAAVPPGRLLEFDVARGWGPLCAFLDVDAPDEPFPNVNDREFFRAAFGLDRPAS
jgi:sulfotransferase family protein